MKWIGQNIYDYISRFRNDIYLEGISTSTETDMLVVDSNNKVSKRAIDAITVDVSDFMTNGSDNRILTATGTDAMNAEANLTFDGSTLSLTGDLSVTGDTVTFTSANADDPAVIIQNTTSDAEAARLQFIKNRGADGVDNDNVGEIEFWSYDDGTPTLQQYGRITTKIHDATSDEESGQFNVNVASHDGGLNTGLKLTGGSVDAEVDVEIGRGAASVTDIQGTLSMGGTNTINNSGVVQVAAQNVIDHDQLANFAANEHFTQANITTVGTITSGVWRGTAINSTYLDADTAHYSAQKQLTYHSYKADQDTTKTYLGLLDADSEETATSSKVDLPLTAPVAGKLLKVFLRSNKNLNSHTLTWRLETISSGANFSSTPAVIGTQSGAGCQNTTMTTYDFTTGLDSGTNAIAAADAVHLSLQSDTDFGSNVIYYVTCLWEWDLS